MAESNKKIIIITGATSGIGKACLYLFAKNGNNVVFCSIDEPEGKILESEINLLNHGKVLFIKCDLRVEEDIKHLVERTKNEFGRIDCLINNAGDHPPHGPIETHTADDFRKLLDLNVVAYFLTAKYCMPYLRQSQGCIINNASLVGRMGDLGAATYCATKGAVSAMTRALAIDEAKYNVRINAFSPGNIWTPLWEKGATINGVVDQAIIKEGENAQLLGRFGTPDECAEVCYFLAFKATFLTGVDLPVTGGAELGYGYKNRIV